MPPFRPSDQAEQNEDVGLNLEGGIEDVNDVVDTHGYASDGPQEEKGSRE